MIENSNDYLYLKNMAWKIFNILNGRQSEMLQSYFDLWSKLIWVKNPAANVNQAKIFKNA